MKAVLLLTTISALTLLPGAAGVEIIGGPVTNPANGHVYYLLGQSDWYTAETEAIHLGGHLVTINDQAEQDFVWAAFSAYGGTTNRSFWIGLGDLAKNGTFVWRNGEASAFSNWAPGEPNGEDIAGVVHIWPAPSSRAGTWNDELPEKTTYASESWEATLHGIVEVSPGPPRWLQWGANGHYYALTAVAHTNWFEAEAEAASHAGGHLLSINSAEEQAFIEKTFLSDHSRHSELWIGLNDIVSEGTWIWSSGEPLTFSNWAPDEPNNWPPGEDAGVLNWQYASGLRGAWNDWYATDPPTGVRAFFGIMEVPSLVQHFSKIQHGDAVQDTSLSTGVAWVDYDDDGHLDLFVSAHNRPSQLFRNDGDGALVRTAITGLTTDSAQSLSAVWADFDNSGLPDAFVASFEAQQPNLLYRAQGRGTFTRLSEWPFGDTTQSVSGAWGDFDNDGFLDLFVANRAPGQFNYLYRNLGNGSFSKVLDGSIANEVVLSTAASWGDYDNDGDLDLFASTEGGESNRLYRNEGQGRFTRITAGPVVSDGGVSRGCAWGDYNNDGFLDLCVVAAGPNKLYRNNQNGTFTRVTDDPVVTDGDHSIGCAWGDYDNDGWLDLMVTNLGGHDALYHNEAGQGFTRVRTGPVVADAADSRGCAWGDYNNDGALDLYVSTDGGQQGLLYRNDACTNHWLSVRCIGTRSNSSGIGTKVRLRTEAGWQMREISGGTGYGSQDGMLAHFGMGVSERAVELRVEWPSGVVQEFRNVTGDQRLTVSEPPTLSPIGLVPELGFEMALLSRGGYSYQIDWTGDLMTWTPALASHGVNGSVQIVDTAAEAMPLGFYRAQEMPRSGSGLAAWWAAEGNGQDESGQHDAQVQGTVGYAPGVYGQAFNFPEAGGWLQTPAPVTAKVDDWSMEAWVNWRGLGGAPTKSIHSILSNGGTGTDGYGVFVSDEGVCAANPSLCGRDGMLVAFYGGLRYFPASRGMPVGQWTHVALVREQGVLKMYVNGTLEFAEPTDAPKPPAAPTVIGYPDASGSFNGLIDEARVWSRALSGREVRDIHRVGALRIATSP